MTTFNQVKINISPSLSHLKFALTLVYDFYDLKTRKRQTARRRVKVTKRQILFENNAFCLKTNKFSEIMSKRYIFPQQYGERKKAKLDVTVSDHNFPVSQNSGTGKGI